MKQIHIKLSETLHRELRIQAAIKGQTLQDYVVDAIESQIMLDRANLTSAPISTQGSNGDDDTK